MRHSPPPEYRCNPRMLGISDAALVTGLYEGVCPEGHSLQPVPTSPGRRAGDCHQCCPCAHWEWIGAPGTPVAVRFCAHNADYPPEGDHC